MAIDSNPLTELVKPQVTSNVANGAVGVSVNEPVTAAVKNGKLSTVTMTNPEGVPVAGAMSPDGQSWQSAEPLGYDRQYRLQVEANGLTGSVTTNSTFTTSAPDNLTKPYLMVGDNEVVGVGQPVGVKFDEPIPDRIAAQNAITVTTDPPVEGAFYWISPSEVRWRPADYWAPGTRIDVAVDVYGKDLGAGLFGANDAHSTYSIGDPLIMTVDDNTLQVTVEQQRPGDPHDADLDGQVGSTPTDNGVYIIAEKHQHIIMDSSTYGVAVNSAEGYRTPVDYATRMSYSGIFLHSAPWSVGAQGSYNTSHGCLNLSPANAIWVYNNVKRGDIVIVKNTVGGTLSGTDGLGDWNIPWDVWRAGNANQS